MSAQTMPAALDVDWDAVQIHFLAIGGNVKATAKSFGISEAAVQRRSVRGNWRKALSEREQTRQTIRQEVVQKVSESVTRAGVSLAEMGEEVKYLAMNVAKKGLEGFLANAPTPENWQEAKLATDIAAKVGNWSAPTAAVQVNVWGNRGDNAAQVEAIDLE